MAKNESVSRNEVGERRTAVSPRQQEVVDLLNGGSAREEIAKKLGISVNTIKKRAKAAFLKLDAEKASQAAAHYYRPQAPAPAASKEAERQQAESDAGGGRQRRK